MAGIHDEWYGQPNNESRERSAEHAHGEPSRKHSKTSVLSQTSQMLSSAGHALSGDGDEAVVILGALAGVAIGTALGIAEKRRQAASQQVKATHDDPPHSSPTQHAGAPHDDPYDESSQSSPTQASAEPRQEPASQQIEQPMEQSM